MTSLSTPCRRLRALFPPEATDAAQLDVAGQSGNGAGIMNGPEIVLAHDQSRQLCEMMPEQDPAFADQANSGVRRRSGWDEE